MCELVCVFDHTFKRDHLCSAFKFYLKNNWPVGAALGFGSDQIRTLVSMAIDSSHMCIIGKQCSHIFSFLLLAHLSH